MTHQVPFDPTASQLFIRSATRQYEAPCTPWRSRAWGHAGTHASKLQCYQNGGLCSSSSESESSHSHWQGSRWILGVHDCTAQNGPWGKVAAFPAYLSALTWAREFEHRESGSEPWMVSVSESLQIVCAGAWVLEVPHTCALSSHSYMVSPIRYVQSLKSLSATPCVATPHWNLKLSEMGPLQEGVLEEPFWHGQSRLASLGALVL